MSTINIINTGKAHILKILSCVLIGSYLLVSINAMGADYIETKKDYKINWTSYKMRFYSESPGVLPPVATLDVDGKTPVNMPEKNFPLTVEAAKKTMPEKLLSLSRQIVELDADRRGFNNKNKALNDFPEFEKLVEEMVRHAYTLDTEYRGDGSVRITWETEFKSLMCSSELRAKLSTISPTSSSSQKFTGLILLAEDQQPTGQMQLLLANGDNLATFACSRHLNPKNAFMPLWVSPEKLSEAKTKAGTNPLIIKIKKLKAGVFTLDESKFEAHGSEIMSALRMGSVVFSTL